MGDNPTPTLGEVGRARAAVAALRVLATIRNEARTVASKDERDALAQWPGWGPMAPMFAPKNHTWVEIAEEVRALLSDADVELGAQGTYNAFYTPPAVAAVMWELLAGLGYPGGPVLEPGCGSGRFIATAPDGAAVTGVDRDPTSTAICALLNPAATVLTGEIQSTVVGNGYAAVIGNVPFGDVKVFDPNVPYEMRTNLHNYCIYRALDALAPGGIAVLLTSRHTLDSHSDMARKQLDVLAEFVGAIRLANGDLEGGTKACADIVVFRRRDGRSHERRAWFTSTTQRFGYTTPINEWWEANPDLVLGTMAKGSTERYGQGLVIDPAPGTAAERIRQAAALLVKRATEDRLVWAGSEDVTAFDAAAHGGTVKGHHDGEFWTEAGQTFKVKDGRAERVTVGRELRDLLALRDLAVKLVTHEADHSISDEDLAPLRAQTAAAYARYVKAHGCLNRYRPGTKYTEVKPGTELWNDVHDGIVRAEQNLITDKWEVATPTRTRPSMGGFRSDPHAALVMALEVYDDETGEGKPAPILTARQNIAPVRPTETDDPRQALAWSLDQYAGQVNIDYIAGLLRADVDAVPGLLGDAVYRDPETLQWVTAQEYLSGNVRVKLTVAETAARSNPGAYQRNADALKAALPEWLGPEQITAQLGTPWIGRDDIQRFVSDLLGHRVPVRRLEATNQWEVDAWAGLRNGVAASADWGTSDKDAYRLIELALNGKVPVVYRTVTINGEERERKDPDASLLASQKQQRIREEFADWVWRDGERADRLVQLYNERYNCLVPRTFSGEHVTVDGLAPWFSPYKHQREFVARALATPASLCGHEMGGGKTATMAMLAMKLRQTGLANKPMVVVPNHLIEQIDREFRQLFPAARILTASAQTISSNRRAFTARCATGDWDIVLVTHAAFNVMPVAPQTEVKYLQAQLEELEASIRAACPDGIMPPGMVKRAAKQRDKLRTRIAELRYLARGRDKGVTFEQLGVDYLIADEAHYWKNLAVPCRTDGFSIRPSKRATNMDMIRSWLAERGSGRHMALFTGTPVSNTLLELYVVLRYLMPDYLRKIGLGSADAWAAAYVKFVTSVDVTIDGGEFALRTRPSLFVNADELCMLLSQVADIRTADQLGLERPAANIRTIAVQPTTAQREFSAELVDRVEKIKGMGRMPTGGDNMLAVCGDGRRAATDPALVGLDDDEPGKLHAADAEILEIWRQHPEELQIVFLDIGTPNAKKGSQTYGRLRRLLTDGGMPVDRIRFIHDAKNDAAKAAMFKDCRAGRVSVIFGSTDKLGVGTNIQNRVIGMHDVDAPYRPSDVGQRRCRGLRPGNRHAVVEIRQYVTERTYDAYQWQLLTRKIGFISQIGTGKVGRTVEDISTDEVSMFEATKAIATGQPLLLEKAKVDAEIATLSTAQRGHRATVERLRRKVSEQNDTVRGLEAEARAQEAIAAAGGELAEGDGERLHEMAQAFGRFSYGSNKGMVAGVTVEFGEWHTMAEQPERHPMVKVYAGAGVVETRGYRFWEPADYAKALTGVLAGAAAAAEWRRRRVAEIKVEIGNAAEMIARPFAQADALTAAKAKLDQIVAALHAAAVGADGPNVDAIVTPAAESDGEEPAGDDDLDDDGTDDLSAAFTELDDLLEEEVRKGLAELFG